MKLPSRKALGPKEIKSINQVIKYYKRKDVDPGYQGYFEDKLCKKFSVMLGGGYADGCASGTAAAYIALSSLELKKNSEVIISPVTDSGPLNAIILLNLKPILIDTDYDNYNVSLEQFKKQVTIKTKAAIIVHAGGDTSQIFKISEFAKKKKIKLIEDCSQAPFAKCYFCPSQCNKCKKKFVGSFSDISFFSTMFSKSISSCGSGGLVFTKNKKLYRKILSYSDRGKQIWNKNKIDLRNPTYALFPALNLNSNEFLSAITLSSLNRIFDTIKKRRNFLKYFLSKLNKSKVLSGKIKNLNYISPFYFPIKVKVDKISISKNKFAEKLKKLGVSLNSEYGCIISTWKWAKKYIGKSTTTPNAINFRDKTFNLFLNENYSKKEANNFISIINKIEKKFLK
jgi:perosamine synthetase